MSLRRQQTREPMEEEPAPPAAEEEAAEPNDDNDDDEAAGGLFDLYDALDGRAETTVKPARVKKQPSAPRRQSGGAAAKKPAAVRKRPAAAPARKAVMKRPAAKAAAVKKKPAAVKKKPAAAKVMKKPAAASKRAVAKRPAARPKPKAKGKAKGKTGGMWKELGKVATKLSKIYMENCAFPKWSVDLLSAGKLEEYAKSVVVYYYTDTDDLTWVKKLATEREPANIGMNRCYDEDALEEQFFYRHGAYSYSTETQLLPNIAIYCKTPIRLGDATTSVHVINIVGYAFDNAAQIDYQYFFPLVNNPDKWAELVGRYKRMWRYVFHCAREHGLKRVYLADVGGGNFGLALEKHPSTSYAKLKKESLPPVAAEYSDIEAHVLERIPDWAFTEEGQSVLEESLLVNAWDPWSMVGNANFSDNSLDGFFGRCTAMAVLCWPQTNPHIRYTGI